MYWLEATVPNIRLAAKRGLMPCRLVKNSIAFVEVSADGEGLRKARAFASALPTEIATQGMELPVGVAGALITLRLQAFGARNLNGSVVEDCFDPAMIRRLDTFASDGYDFSLVGDCWFQLGLLAAVTDLRLQHLHRLFLVGVGLQKKSIRQVEEELDLKSPQGSICFRLAARSILTCCRNHLRGKVEPDKVL